MSYDDNLNKIEPHQKQSNAELWIGVALCTFGVLALLAYMTSLLLGYGECAP